MAVAAGLGVRVETGASVAVSPAVSVRSAAGPTSDGAFAVAGGMPGCVAVIVVAGSPQLVSRIADRNKKRNVLPEVFTLHHL